MIRLRKKYYISKSTLPLYGEPNTHITLVYKSDDPGTVYVCRNGKDFGYASDPRISCIMGKDQAFPFRVEIIDRHIAEGYIKSLPDTINAQEDINQLYTNTKRIIERVKKIRRKHVPIGVVEATKKYRINSNHPSIDYKNYLRRIKNWFTTLANKLSHEK